MTLRSVSGVALGYQNIIDDFNATLNTGEPNANESTVGTGLVGAPACGDPVAREAAYN
jgi:NifU-like protein involved in Fe-S cluster formation